MGTRSLIEKFKPLPGRVLIKRDPEQEKISQGLVIPESARKSPLWVTVLAVGEGTEVKAGDRIIVGRPYVEKSIEAKITLNGEEYSVIREKQILAVLEG